MSCVWNVQAEWQVLRSLPASSDRTVQSVCATTLTRRGCVAHAKLSAKVLPAEAMPTTLRFPQTSSRVMMTEPVTTRPNCLVSSPARSTYSPLENVCSRAPRQPSSAVRSRSLMPANSGQARHAWVVSAVIPMIVGHLFSFVGNTTDFV